ncbi:MAG TPA: S8 family peptidase [Vicinamibacterales bacterium]
MREARGTLWAVMLAVVIVAPGAPPQARTGSRDFVPQWRAGQLPGHATVLTDPGLLVNSTQAFQLGGGLNPLLPNLLGLEKLDYLLLQRVGQLLGRSRVVVTARDAASLGAVGQLLAQVGGILGPLLPIINSRAATVPNIGLATLAASPLVAHVAVDRMVQASLERTGSTIRATAIRQASGLSGAGVGVAVIDSGVVPWHDDLGDVPGGAPRIQQFVDFVNGTGAPYDDHGHGTHVAGIVAGTGFDSGGARTGIAPGAHLVVLKVLDSAGRGYISNVIAALDYVVTHRTNLSIRVVNLSLATAVTESFDTDPLAQATRAATAHGLVVVAAAGNRGRSSQGDTQYGAIGAPGNAPWVLTVGASSHEGTINRSDDTIALFSSRGPTYMDRAAKPDLVAPGVGIESLSAPDSTLYSSRSAYLLEGTVQTSFLPYLSLSGTSQATPVVAGTVALMLEANPELTPNAVKAILQYTAQVYPEYDPLTEGAGFLNARGAVELARFLASPSSEPYPSTQGWSKKLIWGNYRIGGGRLLATGSAWLTSVEWGAARTPTGEWVAWGEICTANCASNPVWQSWQASCGNPACTKTRWGSGTSANVVWGPSCGGADCSSGTEWTTAETVVWGSNGDETVVWGSTGDDTVVWGSTGDETVVWGSTGCSDPSCEPVLWD